MSYMPSLDIPTTKLGPDGPTRIDDIAGPSDTFTSAEKSEQREIFLHVLYTAVPYLDALHRAVLDRRLAPNPRLRPEGPLTLEETGQELGISTERARQIEEAAHDVLLASAVALGYAKAENVRVNASNQTRFERALEEINDGNIEEPGLMQIFDRLAFLAMPLMEDDQRKAFSLHFMEEMPVAYKKIADSMNISERAATKLCKEGLDTVFAVAAACGFVPIGSMKREASDPRVFEAALSKATLVLR